MRGGHGHRAAAEGLDDDACHAPHWGFFMSGEVVITYTNGREETCVGDDLFYWPPTQRAGGEGFRSDHLQPQVEHGEVMNHMIACLADLHRTETTPTTRSPMGSQ